jgi:tRNA pseudouridine32 synthase/23S rRNA pseudouridine746 synthase
MPIVNDPIYPVLLPEGADDFTRPLQLLARSLSFVDPLTGAQRSFTSPRSLSLTPR